jgi:predicted ArsR family transcriptional regulator
MQSQSEVLDIKTVAKMTGLSQHAASYNLKKLADAGMLTQSAISGGRGMPKLMFGLAKAGAGPGTEANGGKGATLRTTSGTAPKPKRTVRKRARRATQRPLS